MTWQLGRVVSLFPRFLSTIYRDVDSSTYLDCDVLHVIINVLQVAGGRESTIALAGRSWGGEPFRGTCICTPRVPRRLRPLRSTVARLGRGFKQLLRTAYAEMHVKIAKCNHQMSADMKLHACIEHASDSYSYSYARLDISK